MKKVFITGISTGFGKALKDIFTKKSYEVRGISKNLNKETELLKKVNISNHTELKKNLLKVFKNINNLDLVILNAGTLGPIKKTNLIRQSIIKNNLDINLFSNKIIIDFLINNKINFKSLIAISSGASINTKYGWFTYALSKVSLRFLIENYALENKKLHFINYNPGLIETKMQKKLRSIDSKIIPSVKIFKDLYNLHKIQNPHEASINLFNNLDFLLRQKSGSYIDSRKI